MLKLTGALRVNHEILGNSEPELHAHIFPRYATEAEERRRMPVWFYDWKNAARFAELEHGQLVQALRRELSSKP